jgi:hypothetical protein
VASYGRSGDTATDPELEAALWTARQNLLRSAGRRGRLRALLWPASLVTGSGARMSARTRRWAGSLRPRRTRAV